ncbi:MAG: RagB/SusD family nutrient uptake outer membrane protein, partial [Bacteroidales bacterium]|nr:RagB/SusD family nutrient uptake outer membrane protein [Bacteroidales bacterium]
MKKILYITLLLAFSLSISSCKKDLLETAPTEKVTGPTIFKDINSAQVAMDGVYRYLFVSGWTTGNTHQNFGILSTNIYTSLMGEDFLQDAQGNGWFYF